MNNTPLTRYFQALLTVLTGICLSASAVATGPRVSPTLFEPDADKVFAVDFPPYISGVTGGGGIDNDIINAVFAEADISKSVTTLPLFKMVKYYLQQEGAVAISGHYFDFNPKERESLIFIPISAPQKYYYYYRPKHPEGLNWNDNLTSLQGRTYGANRGEETSIYRQAGLTVLSGSARAMIKKLIAGEVDFVGMPEETATWLIDKYFAKERDNIVQMEPAAGDLPGFIVFNKKHPQGTALANRFNNALTRIIQSGLYSKLLQQHLGKGEAAQKHLQRLEALRTEFANQ